MPVSIATKNRIPVLNIAGQSTPLVSFFGNYSDVGSEGRQTTCDTIRMAADVAGVHIHSVIMHLPWNHPADGPDYQETDTIIQSLLEADPDTKLMIRFHTQPASRHEDGCHTSLDPTFEVSDRYHNQLLLSDKGTTHGISLASEAWEADLLDNVEGFVRHLLAQPYSDSIMALHPDCNEWFSAVDYHSVGDFSEPMQRAWREWARRNYRDNAELSEAWGSAFAFETMQVPTLEERRTDDGSAVLDPEKARRICDFYRFYNERVAELIIRLGRTIKMASQGRYLSLFFYGYLFELSNNFLHGTQQSGHCALRKILDSESIDMLSGPISYFERWDVAENGGSYFMCPVDSITANGKIWIQEDDARTYLKTGNGGLTPAKSLESTLHIARKNMANTIVHNAGTWFMDLPAQGWLKDARIW